MSVPRNQKHRCYTIRRQGSALVQLARLGNVFVDWGEVRETKKQDYAPCWILQPFMWSRRMPSSRLAFFGEDTTSSQSNEKSVFAGASLRFFSGVKNPEKCIGHMNDANYEQNEAGKREKSVSGWMVTVLDTMTCWLAMACLRWVLQTPKQRQLQYSLRTVPRGRPEAALPSDLAEANSSGISESSA